MSLPREGVRLVLTTAVPFVPLIFMVLRLSTLGGNENQQAHSWTKYRYFDNAICIVAVVLWCVLWDPTMFGSVLFWSAPTVATFMDQATARAMDRRILERRWNAVDIMRLAWWSTVHPTISILCLSRGFNAVFDGKLNGSFWFFFAAAVALIGPLRFRLAQGMRLRRVKSGTLYTRALHLARKAGVTLERVSVVPPGRGELTNAFASGRSIALTDNFGEYLHGPQLDAVICHELAHVKNGHIRSRLLFFVALFIVPAALLFRLPAVALLYRPLLVGIALLAPILGVYYTSRLFEYEADQKAVELTGDAEAGIRALAALYRQTGISPECGPFVELFMTHPSLTRRLIRIARIYQLPSHHVAEVLAEAGSCGIPTSVDVPATLL